MRRNFSLAVLFMASLLILSAQAFAQVRTERVNERIQQTVVRNSRVDLAQWLRLSRSDARNTEILSLTLSGQSFTTGELQIKAKDRVIDRVQFRRTLITKTFTFPQGTKVADIEITARNEVFVESVSALIRELRFEPPRPTPPRHGPAPRPAPPKPAPQPAPRPGQPAPRR